MFVGLHCAYTFREMRTPSVRIMYMGIVYHKSTTSGVNCVHDMLGTVATNKHCSRKSMSLEIRIASCIFGNLNFVLFTMTSG